MNKLRKRILELAYKNKLSHIGSALSCVEILDEIYSKRKPTDPVVLSCGHAGLALYCVLEKYEGQNAQELIEFCGVHPSGARIKACGAQQEASVKASPSP